VESGKPDYFEWTVAAAAVVAVVAGAGKLQKSLYLYSAAWCCEVAPVAVVGSEAEAILAVYGRPWIIGHSDGSPHLFLHVHGVSLTEELLLF
jgi:hypothetical protein